MEHSVHKRRVRYKGTHPKKYDEKYKELHPEKYKETIEKVMQKGMTPAGMHIPIMVEEILSFLKITPGQTGLDATLGYGGHTTKMLEQLQGKGHLYSLDIDPIEIEKATRRLREKGFLEDILTTKLLNFGDINDLTNGQEMFDFVLADLGVSSMQIDNPQRGFTFKADGPLDLRLNPHTGISAAHRLQRIKKDELKGMLQENADEPYAKEIAEVIVKNIRKGNSIDTTRKLYDVIEEALCFIPEKERKEAVKKSCQRTFQALRIDVNNEFEVLEIFMEKLPSILKPGGRVAILTFHSGEDRIVKKAFKSFKCAGIYSEIAEEVTRPQAEECFRNSRSHSTKMRWAIKKE